MAIFLYLQLKNKKQAPSTDGLWFFVYEILFRLHGFPVGGEKVTSQSYSCETNSYCILKLVASLLLVIV